MILCRHNELGDAFKHAEAGAQVLYIRRVAEAAWLIDHNIDRLILTARRLGIRRIYVGRRGLAGQHIELKGRPYVRAIEECRTPELAL